MALHHPPQERRRCAAIPAFRGEYLERLALAINRSPEIMHLTVDPDEQLVDVPASSRITMTLNAKFPDFGREYRTEAIPPEPYRLVANVEASLKQQFLDSAQRQALHRVEPRFADQSIIWYSHFN